ncbi:hypothetical protein FGB62_36g112 [Gracilaria domingensis]|nr:hypothetical protein FGB62_36g112 [Gracilaria domingensis]
MAPRSRTLRQACHTEHQRRVRYALAGGRRAYTVAAATAAALVTDSVVASGTGTAGAEGIARVCLTCWHDVGAIAWSGGGAARNSGGAQLAGRALGEARRQPAAAAGALTQDARIQVLVFQTAGSQRTGYDGHLVALAKPLIVALDAQRLGPGAAGAAQ